MQGSHTDCATLCARGWGRAKALSSSGRVLRASAAADVSIDSMALAVGSAALAGEVQSMVGCSKSEAAESKSRSEPKRSNDHSTSIGERPKGELFFAIVPESVDGDVVDTADVAFFAVIIVGDACGSCGSQRMPESEESIELDWE